MFAIYEQKFTDQGIYIAKIDYSQNIISNYKIITNFKEFTKETFALPGSKYFITNFLDLYISVL